MVEVLDPYDVLEISPGVDARAVRAAYRRLARLHHPDRGGSGQAMARLNAAYAVLRDHRRRAAYDAARRTLAHATPVPDPGEMRPGGGLGRGRPSGRGSRSDEAPAPTTQTAWAGHLQPDAGGPLARARARAVGDAPAAESESGGTAGAGLGGSRGRSEPTGGPRALDFGRYQGWTLAQIAGVDPDFLEWLERMPIGRQYRPEIDVCLRAVGRRPSAAEPWEAGPSTFARAARANPRAMQAQRFAFLHRR